MNVKIDQAGRIVLPKPVRDRLGLRAGADLELVESHGGVVLTPAARKPSLVRRKGVLMHTGKLPKGYDWNRLVEEERDDRIRKLAGL